MIPLAANLEIAERFEEVARLLDEQGANPFRTQAYRRASQTLRGLRRPVAEILDEEGLEGLERLPGIGGSLARAIRVQVLFGRFPMLERLRGETDPEALLRSVPGVGPKLAERFHHELGIDSLEELELAAWDGRLASIEGVGERRLAGIRDSLATRLRRRGRRSAGPPSPDHPAPPVAVLLELDRLYREKAAAGELRRIAPRRFNPSGEAWLPVLHAHRDEGHFTVLYSNTPRAHRLGKTHDWVVLYHDGGRGEKGYTVTTSQWGPLRGRRTVRGREAECMEHYGLDPEAGSAG